MQRAALEALESARPLVLIIDADESARTLYGHWFAHRQFQVMCAVGIEGLAMALRRDCPQLIVTEMEAGDLTLPDLMARLRSSQRTRCIPVMVLTKHADAADMDYARASGAVTVLPKFADFETLAAWVGALLG